MSFLPRWSLPLLAGLFAVAVEYGYMASPGGPLRKLSMVMLGTVVGFMMPLYGLVGLGVLFVRSLGTNKVLGNVSLADILFLLLILRLLVKTLGTRSLRITPASGWLIFFFVWVVATTVLGHTSMTPILRLVTYGLASVMLAAQSAPARTTVYRFFVGYAVVELLLTVRDQLGSRLIGATIGDPQQLSIVLLAGLAPLLGRHLRFPGRRAVIVALIAGIILTRTRGAWGALLILLVVSRMRDVSGRKLVAITAGLFACGILLFGPLTRAFDLNPESKLVRQESVMRGIRAGARSPVVGHGWGASINQVVLTDDTIGRYVAETQPFNLWVSVWAFSGIPGVILITGFLASMMTATRKYDQSAYLFMVAFLGLSLVEMTLYAGSLGTVIFFVYAGLGQRPATHESPTPTPGRARPRALAAVPAVGSLTPAALGNGRVGGA